MYRPTVSGFFVVLVLSSYLHMECVQAGRLGDISHFAKSVRSFLLAVEATVLTRLGSLWISRSCA